MMTDQHLRAARPSGPHRSRLRFERLPAAYCHPERLSGLLPDGLPAGFRDRLQGSARLRLRLSTLIARRFALEPVAPDDLATPEGRFVRLDGEDLQNAVRRVGAIWHARALRRVILKDELAKLVEHLGRDNHRAALRFIDLAPENEADDEGEAPDLDGLMGRIERAGLASVNGWCRHQPAALAARLKLKLPPCPEVDGEPEGGHRCRGPMIVDRVVMMLEDEATTVGTNHD